MGYFEIINLDPARTNLDDIHKRRSETMAGRVLPRRTPETWGRDICDFRCKLACPFIHTPKFPKINPTLELDL